MDATGNVSMQSVISTDPTPTQHNQRALIAMRIPVSLAGHRRRIIEVGRPSHRPRVRHNRSSGRRRAASKMSHKRPSRDQPQVEASHEPKESSQPSAPGSYGASLIGF